MIDFQFKTTFPVRVCTCGDPYAVNTGGRIPCPIHGTSSTSVWTWTSNRSQPLKTREPVKAMRADAV